MSDVPMTRLFPLPPVKADGDAAIADWYARADHSEPWLRVNFISSLDGSATLGGLSGRLGTDADHRVFDILRTLCDVVIVGAGTVRAEGYGPLRVDAASVAARVARGLSPQPVFAIVTNSLDFQPDDRIFSDAPVRPIVVTSERSSEQARAALATVADLAVCGGTRVRGGAMRDALVERGLPQMHCEGGPALFASLVDDGAVDELCLTMSPMLAGGGGPRITNGVTELARQMRLGHVLESDGTLLLRYERA